MVGKDVVSRQDGRISRATNTSKQFLNEIVPTQGGKPSLRSPLASAGAVSKEILNPESELSRICNSSESLYNTNYVFKLFSLGHLIQIESDSFIWILDLGWARTPPFIIIYYYCLGSQPARLSVAVRELLTDHPSILMKGPRVLST